MRFAFNQFAKFVGLMAALLLCLSLVVIMCSAEEKATHEASHHYHHQQQQQSARGKFQLPKLFDFSRFKSLFRKSYRSLLEELARQKIFLGRAFKAFVSAVGYKHGKASSYLGVNQMSDWTPAEIERSKVGPNKLRGRRGNTTPATPVTTATKKQEEETPAAELEDIEQELEVIEEHGDQPGFKEVVEELRGSIGSRSRRDISNQRKRQLKLDDLMGSPEAAMKTSQKYERRVPTNNPNYEPPELMSQGLGGESPDSMNNPVVPDSVFSMINKIPGLNYLRSVVADQISFKFKDEPEATELQASRDSYDEPKPDTVFVDHRQSNCFLPVRDQGQCGACYAFATIALYEYQFCMDTGHLVPFSEQYMIDCIPFLKGEAVGGCDGADIDLSTEFVEIFGLELQVNYPFREEDGQCPYDKSTSELSAGYLRLERGGSADVEVSMLAKKLWRTPIMVGVKISPNFRFYKGGVDENRNCAEDDLHAMLIVGRGREDGKQYWLLRNSHSTAWGEQGYWKVSNTGLKRCIADEAGVEIYGSFNRKGHANPHYENEPIRRHNAQFL